MTKKQSIFSIVVLVICFLGASYLESEMQKVDELTRADFDEQMVMMNR